MKKQIIIGLAIAAILNSCDRGKHVYDPALLDSTALVAVSKDSYEANVATLASDEFQGRKPFTKGDTLAVSFIEQQFKSLGLKPGNGSSFFQEVPMVEITSMPARPTLTFVGKKG